MADLTYLDHAATAPLRPEVSAAMAEVHARPLGNPTGSHPAAQRARKLLEEARDGVAQFMDCAAGDVIFTSGGTESANLALLGSVAAAQAAGRTRPLVLHSAVEHPAVLESCRALAMTGQAEVRVLPVDAAGRVELGALHEALAGAPLLVAVMAANNETGVLQPLGDVLDDVCTSAPGTGVFTDAVQAAPHLDLAQLTARADLIGISAHKVGGPVGTGALIVRAGWPLAPLQHGGGQERERRSGTQDVAGAVGLATALRLAAAEREVEAQRVAALRDRLADGLRATVNGLRITVPDDAPTLPGHLHLCLKDIEREELLVALGQYGICVSGGSSCASGALEPSHVLAAMAVPDAWAGGAVRFSLGRSSTGADVERALSVVPSVVRSLRTGASVA
jgi:cysteine desulfurase